MKKSVTKQSINALKDFKATQEIETHNKLVEAINRLTNNKPIVVNKGTKLNVTDLAKEAGVSRGSVYKHKDIIERIHSIRDNPHKSDYQIKKAQEAKRIEAEKKNKSILDQLKIDKENLAQENYRLHFELDQVRVELDNEKVKNGKYESEIENLTKLANSRKFSLIDGNGRNVR